MNYLCGLHIICNKEGLSWKNRIDYAFEDGVFYPQKITQRAFEKSSRFFLDPVNTVAEAVASRVGQGKQPWLDVHIDQETGEVEKLDKLDQVRILELSPDPDSENPLIMHRTLRLYRIEIQEREDIEDFFTRMWEANQSLSYYEMDQDVLRFLCHYKPTATLIDEVTLSFDHQEYDFTVRLKQAGADPRQLKKSEALAFTTLFPVGGWVGSGNGHSKYFKQASSMLRTTSWRMVISLLYRSPSLRQCWRECGSLKPIEFIIADHANQELLTSGDGPAKVLGISKTAFKIITGVTANNPTLNSYTVFKTLSNAARKISRHYNDQITENFLLSLSKYLNQEDKDQSDLLCATDVIANIFIDRGGPKGKNYSVDKLLAYITHDVDVYQAITSPQNAVDLLCDYYRSQDIMGTKIKDYFPRSLKLAHDVAARNAKIVKTQEFTAYFAKTVSNASYQNRTYQDKEYSVFAPACVEDLVQEGALQHHCVGTYVNDVADGNTCIYFMRRTDAPNVPVITLEVNPETDQLVQYRGSCNRSATAEEMKWIRKWCRIKKLGIH